MSPRYGDKISIPEDLQDAILLPAIRSRAVCISLANKKLTRIPKGITALSASLQKLNAKNNLITELFEDFGCLQNLTELHLGNNKLTEFPNVLVALSNLEKLHLHNNEIMKIPENCLGRLTKLKVLNLNSNKIEEVPSDIGFLEHLKMLSIDKNRLKTFPNEIAHCVSLEELHASDNELTSLPIGFGYLTKMKKCNLRKNSLQDLPETFGKLVNLRLLDLAANDIRIFPTKFYTLKIAELYVENNQLIAERPVRSIQEDEVISLKELTSRFCLKELSQPNSLLRRTIKHYPALREMLALASKCALCNSLFLNTWLECVHFIDSRQIVKNCRNSVANEEQSPNAVWSTPGKIPIRALLCSYKCFNSQGDETDAMGNKSPIKYYGVAFPASPPVSAAAGLGSIEN